MVDSFLYFVFRETAQFEDDIKWSLLNFEFTKANSVVQVRELVNFNMATDDEYVTLSINLLAEQVVHVNFKHLLKDRFKYCRLVRHSGHQEWARQGKYDRDRPDPSIVAGEWPSAVGQVRLLEQG